MHEKRITQLLLIALPAVIKKSTIVVKLLYSPKCHVMSGGHSVNYMRN